MKLSISNIAWEGERDAQVYGLMRKYGYSGLEIAPTRIFPENPYDRNGEGEAWSQKLKKAHGLSVSSMQSIWFGCRERIFGSREERQFLMGYTKKAIRFAASVGCNNLVFGCPRNRSISEGTDVEIGVKFFRELGEYAAEHGTVIGMEANPAIYHTNYINDTLSALRLIDQVDSRGFLLNLDVGTMIQNGESVDELAGRAEKINHVHISEPGLGPLEERGIHVELQKFLAAEKYQGFISIEMGRSDDIQMIEERMRYIRGVFG